MLHATTHVIGTYALWAHVIRPVVFTPALLATNHVTTVHECTYHHYIRDVCFRTLLSNLPYRDEVNLQALEINKEV